jgi:hypothetical protein
MTKLSIICPATALSLPFPCRAFNYGGATSASDWGAKVFCGGRSAKKFFP